VARVLFVVLTQAALSTSGYAQTADNPTVAAARARFDEGVAFYDKGQYENARAAFLQAYALQKHPAVLLNLAQSSLRSGHTVEAARYFVQYLHESSSLTTAQRGDAEKGLAEARLALGRLEITAADGAEIFVDRARVGIAPLTDLVDVEPGSHEILANADAKSVMVAAGQVLPVQFALAPAPGNASAAQGFGGGAMRLFSRPKTLTPVWISLGVGVAGGATAVVFAILWGQANTSYTHDQTTVVMPRGIPSVSLEVLCRNASPQLVPGCATLNSDQNQIKTDAVVADVGLGVGIAGAAFGLGWYLFAPKQDAVPTSSANVGSFVPILGTRMNGLGYAAPF
jgi:hypothetical protein